MSIEIVLIRKIHLFFGLYLKKNHIVNFLSYRWCQIMEAVLHGNSA